MRKSLTKPDDVVHLIFKEVLDTRSRVELRLRLLAEGGLLLLRLVQLLRPHLQIRQPHKHRRAFQRPHSIPLLERRLEQARAERIVEDGEQVDWLIYMFFPGRTVEVDDTHARLRAKYIRLAEFLDSPSSNGTLQVGWMDCVFNVIPHPHGAHVHHDTIALYAARKKAPAVN